MAIEWKELEEAPFYFINNRGEVLSKRTSRPKLMKNSFNKWTGYLQTTAVSTEPGEKPIKTITLYPHILVAKYFVDNPNNLNRVNHKDLNKTNNHYWNLEWTSQMENIHHYYNSNAKDKPRQMRPVECWTLEGDFVGEYPSINQCAKEVGCAANTVWKSCIGEVKNPKLYKFRFVED